jgi:uncharacterized metal-binding protein YceD (DUF177 family)
MVTTDGSGGSTAGRLEKETGAATVRAVATASFVVKLGDLEHGPRTVTFPITEDWLRTALAGTDATPSGKPGSVTVELTKNDRDVLVRGRAEASVTVPCVVTLDPLPFELRPEIFLMLEQVAAPPRPKKAKEADPKRELSAKAQKRPRKRKDADDLELSPEDAARDTFSGDDIVLDAFVREFILLEIPPYPRRSDLPSAEESLSSRPFDGSPTKERPVDPRLQPLQGILERLRGEADKE